MSLYTVLDPAVELAYLAVTGLAEALPHSLPHGGRIAVAVVAVTWAVRAALFPLTLSAARARRASAALAPHVARLRQRHTGDPVRLGQEIRRVHREAGVSPFAGVLPSLAQLPVISTMYRLLVVPLVAGRPNAVLHAVVLGVPLGGHWSTLLAAGGVLPSAALPLAGLLAALTLLAWLSSRQITRTAAVSATSSGQQPGLAAVRLLRWLPYATVGLAVIAPPAVGLYLLATTAWTVTERMFLPA